MTQEDFIQIIRDARQQMGITQQQLSDAAKTSKFTVCQFENGKGNVSLNTLCDMLTALNVRLVPVDEKRQQIIEQIVTLAKEL